MSNTHNTHKTLKKLLNVSIILVMFASPLLITGCHLVEINMVQRAIIEEGDGIASTHENAESIAKHESDAMELVVPLK